MNVFTNSNFALSLFTSFRPACVKNSLYHFLLLSYNFPLMTVPPQDIYDDWPKWHYLMRSEIDSPISLSADYSCAGISNSFPRFSSVYPVLWVEMTESTCVTWLTGLWRIRLPLHWMWWELWCLLLQVGRNKRTDKIDKLCNNVQTYYIVNFCNNNIYDNIYNIYYRCFLTQE